MAAAANFSPGDQVQGTRSKTMLTLSQLIGRGGEGDVYAVRERTGVLAKLYRTQVDWQLAAKLDHLASRSKPSLRAISAWPEETLRSRSGDPVGFLMPAVSGSEPLYKLTSPKARRQSFPNASFEFLVEVGINTAQAIQTFHSEDLVVGDINSKNILVSQNGKVTFIDMDSVQVGDGRQFPCTVGVPEYTPPELQGHSLATHRRRRDADLFGLPVIIHQLLATGRHPFDGPADRGKAIKFHYSAFSRLPFRPRPLKPVGLEPEEVFDDRLIELLRHAFSPTTRFFERPPAKAWVDALKDFQSHLTGCRHNKQHQYRMGLRHCPWCEVENRGNPPIFAPTQFQYTHWRDHYDGMMRLLLGRFAPLALPETYAAVPRPVWFGIGALLLIAMLRSCYSEPVGQTVRTSAPRAADTRPFHVVPPLPQPKPIRRDVRPNRAAVPQPTTSHDYRDDRKQRAGADGQWRTERRHRELPDEVQTRSQNE